MADFKSYCYLFRWEFETIDYDIGFSLLHESVEVHSYQRWDAHLEKAKGSTLCQNAGKCKASFKNKTKQNKLQCTIHTNQECCMLLDYRYDGI